MSYTDSMNVFANFKPRMYRRLHENQNPKNPKSFIFTEKYNIQTNVTLGRYGSPLIVDGFLQGIAEGLTPSKDGRNMFCKVSAPENLKRIKEMISLYNNEKKPPFTYAENVCFINSINKNKKQFFEMISNVNRSEFIIYY